VLTSMTGFGRAEVSKKGMAARVEVRGVNSRYLEVTARLPRTLSSRENDVKEIVRKYINRGKVNVQVSLDSGSNGSAPLKINVDAAKAYYKLLEQLRKEVKLKEHVNLSHLLQFSEVLQATDDTEAGETEWHAVEQALNKAMKEFNLMRQKEGKELSKDFKKRIEWMGGTIDKVEKLSKERIPVERKRLHERVEQLLEDKTVLDQKRLELELILLSDKLDVTEECVRYRSHNKFFLEAMVNDDSAGRKLNFLVQEMNREANTIGSKSNDATIAHIVVNLKEEIEKIREQLQNIE